MSHDAPTEPAGQPADFDDFDEGLWNGTAADADPTGANMFTAEIENVTSSDWEVDPDVIWGDEPGPAEDIGGVAWGADFAV